MHLADGLRVGAAPAQAVLIPPCLCCTSGTTEPVGHPSKRRQFFTQGLCRAEGVLAWGAGQWPIGRHQWLAKGSCAQQRRWLRRCAVESLCAIQAVFLAEGMSVPPAGVTH